MLQFYRFVDTADNLQKIEVEKIQTYVMGELNRQNQLANQTKVGCENKLLELQNVLEEVIHISLLAVFLSPSGGIQMLGKITHIGQHMHN